jgi:hypothetical protein
MRCSRSVDSMNDFMVALLSNQAEAGLSEPVQGGCDCGQPQSNPRTSNMSHIRERPLKACSSARPRNRAVWMGITLHTEQYVVPRC